MRRITTISAVRHEVGALRRNGARIGLVPTMGALHRAHLALVRCAAKEADAVVVSIFVNPTQFDRPDDLAAYPRDLGADEAALAALGSQAPAIVFAPSVEEMYAANPSTTVRVADVTANLCGASRPGHFDGVATVVTKLCNIVQPDVAIFGRKDRQQLAVIDRLAADLNLPVRIVGAPIVRDGDGVALSSRNQLLNAEARGAARALSQALAAGVRHVRTHRPSDVIDVVQLAETVRARLTVPGVTIDYAEVVDRETMQPPSLPVTGDDPIVIAVAAFVDGVRLIDNVELGHADEHHLLETTATVE